MLAGALVTRRSIEKLHVDRRILTINDMNGDGARADDPQDTVLAMAWDDSSRPIERMDDNGNSTTYFYDSLDRLVQTPFDLHSRIISLIEAETETAKEGKPAAIRAKMNALIERDVIHALYRASQASRA